VMRRRLTLLRKAIIESSEIEINGVSVSKMAEDELYIIQFLSKGRVAPDLEGVGSSGQPMKLSDYSGKVVVLLFWRFEEDTNGQLVEMVRVMKERFTGKPFEVVGVNRDTVAQLREAQTSRGIQWPNFSDPDNKLGAQYRVASWPLAYVIDGSRKIAYVGGVSSFVELTAAALLEEKR
jgi:peroxiredoxin